MSCALFAYCLLSVSLSESFDFLKIRILNIFFVIKKIQKRAALINCTLLLIVYVLV